MSIGILELSAVMLLAAMIGILSKLLRQPLILAYLITGALVGYLGVFNLIDHETFQIFADLGIMFLLFLVGLEINYSSLRLVGRASLIIGLGQIILTTLFGYLIAHAFGLSSLSSLYVAVALTFSSTIIIIKLLSDKKDLNSLYGKITIGFMLVQDACAILLLVLLSGIRADTGINWWGIISVTLKAMALFGSMIWLGRNVFPMLFDKIARSQELLFLVSTAWVLLVSAFAGLLDFPIAVGGFLAGVSLAGSSEHFAIASRIKPLRDFFILAFFVILGSSLIGFSFQGLVIPIIVLSLFVLIGNPLIVLILMGLMGYHRRTSFLTGIATAQVSEFSLILVALGLKVGHIDEKIVAIVTATAVITILFSTYLITHSDKLAKRLSRALSVFQRKHLIENNIPTEGYHQPIILVGAHRTGQSIMRYLPKDELLIVDFDPDIVREYRTRGYACLMGSMSDEDIFAVANPQEARLIISTSPDFEDNMTLLEFLKNSLSKAKVIVRAESEQERKLLYQAGAHYVIFPHRSMGQFLGKHISDHPDFGFLNILRKNDLASIAKDS